MLRRIVEERWFRASAVVGFWPANAEGDDILVFADEARGKPIAVLHTLRQQLARREGRANVALADFVAPRAAGSPTTSAPSRSPPASARTRSPSASSAPTTTIPRSWSRRWPTGWRKPSPSACTSACAREFWGYAPDEALSTADLIAEKYRGIRPAPGYPAQPDHTEKGTLFELLDGERPIGVKLTESFAMWPGASVCGLYFSHPESHYFGVGKIERDQVEDYARRKGWTLAEAEKWLAPILNYDPLAAARTAAE